MFEGIFLDRAVKDMRIVNHVREAFPAQEIILVDGADEVLRLVDRTSTKTTINSGKRLLYLNHTKGKLIRFCPANSKGDYRCCNLHTINLMTNCIFNCAYCILQTVLNSPLMQVHCNLDEIFQELKEFDAIANPKTRICTGEVADSLAFDSVVHQAAYLVEFFASCQNLYLILKTKADSIENLLQIDPKGRTVVSFSLNPERVVRSVEFHTAPLENRLNAARKLLDRGYKIALNLDPVIFYEGWETDYAELIDIIKKRFQPSEIAWFHIGLLRYAGNLDHVVRQRFPGLNLLDQEFITGPDGKARYPKPLRDSMYRFVFDNLRSWHENVILYTCVEQKEHWQQFFGWVPEDMLDLNRYVSGRL